DGATDVAARSGDEGHAAGQANRQAIRGRLGAAAVHARILISMGGRQYRRLTPSLRTSGVSNPIRPKRPATRMLSAPNVQRLERYPPQMSTAPNAMMWPLREQVRVGPPASGTRRQGESAMNAGPRAGTVALRCYPRRRRDPRRAGG